MNVAKQMRDRKEAKGLTITKLGQRSEVGHARMSRFLSGESTPSLPVLERIAKALGCKVKDLVA